MDKAKRIACHRCRSKHLKCNGVWPSCGRCDTLGLSCRYQSPVRFVYWTEQEFASGQRWVRSSARTFCIDKSVPEAAWSPLDGLLDHSDDDALPADDDDDGRGSPVSIVSDPDSPAEAWDEVPTHVEEDMSRAPRESAHPHLRPASHHAPPSPEAHGHGFMDDSGFTIGDQHLTKLDESPNVSHGSTASRADHADLPTGIVPSISRALDPLSNLSQSLLRYYHIPSFSHEPYASSSVTSNPTTRLPTLKPRKFPLVDFLEAYLFKYFIDEVAPWLDIADPDRYFELVVPIIARSNPPLLCAVLALAARHLLVAPPGPEPTGRRSYKDAVRARVTKLSVIELVLECLPSLCTYDASPEDERPGLLTALVLLRQVELIDRDCGPADRCFGSASSSAGNADTFLPVFNVVVQGPDFQRILRRSGLAQAAYMLALRQEMYYSMASGQPPAIALAGCPPFHPFAYEMTVNMIKVLGACWCNERAGRAPAEVLDQLMQRQRDLKEDILLGIRPIFEHRAGLADDAIPTLWYASKTEVYLVQLSKMALAILINSRPNSSAAAMLDGRDDTNATRDLLRDTFAIALGRGESPHAMFHASMMARLHKDTPVGEEAIDILQRSTERLKEMRIWPFRHIVELHWK